MIDLIGNKEVFKRIALLAQKQGFKFNNDNDKTKTITINAIDFIGSIVQHIPEKYFHMVYYYGIFSTRSKQKYLPLINQLHPTTRIYNRIPKNYASRMFFFLGFNPFICACGELFQKFCLIIPGYPTIYYDDLQLKLCYL